MAMDLSSASQNPPFRSRRSYPSLKQISLTPLAPRFPVDDDNANRASGDSDVHNNDRHRKSYLSSSSVPGTPSLLSHSRSTSRARRHARSKSSSGGPRLSRTSTSTDLPQQGSQQRHSIGGEKKELVEQHHHHQDPEWLLRTGIALASSTREEKGQSWLAKRESSTSLVSDDEDDAALLPKYHNHHHHHHHYHHHHHNDHHGNHQLKFDRKSMKSGKSTPGTYSRYASRRGSRADIAMTPSGGDTIEGSAHYNPRRSQSGIASPTSIGSFPDFVDEHIRAEMDSIRRDLNTRDHLPSPAYSSTSSPASSFSADESESDSEDEIDEQEMQRLTRERGFGFGGWLDRLVEWTLFSVRDGPSPHGGGSGIQQRDAIALDNTPTCGHDENLKDPSESSGNGLWATAELGDDDGDGDDSLAKHDHDDHDDETLSTIVEKPGEEGGWKDVEWLFKVVKRALF